MAEEMEVLDRWKRFIKNELFLTFFDEETKVLSERIFGVIPETEKLYIKNHSTTSVIKKIAREKIINIKFWIPFDKKEFKGRYANLLNVLKVCFPKPYSFLERVKRRYKF